MNVRGMFERDLPQVEELHNKFFEGQFKFPEFFKNNLCSFICEEDNQIICATAVKLVPEIILVTDMNSELRTRSKALHHVLNASKHIANRAGYEQLTASIQDEVWLKHLLKNGFRISRGTTIVTESYNG